MIPTYLNSSTSPFPAALSEDHLLQPFNAKPQESSSSSLPTHAFTYSIQDQGGFYHRELHHQEYQQEVNNLASNNGESNDHLVLDTRERDRGLKLSLWKKEVDNEDQTSPAKWMCSKLRVMRKMMNSNHTSGTAEAPTEVQIKLEDQIKRPSSPLETTYRNNSCSTDSNSPIRVCSDCNTTKTPLWRSGPRGPKSLCNACGIRQRKARRAMAAAAAAAAATTEENNASLGAETSPLKIKLQHKAKRSNTNGHVSQHKKRSKLATTRRAHGRKKLCFEDFLVSLSKNLACHQVFPQDEKEAAILLMALSCGLVHG